jgi:demethylmenaquinone methyltransferase/2-methoxy-6-polyprenyl-1,4-benzoquinol methylase
MQKHVIHEYRKRASHYDAVVHAFNLFRSFGFDLDGWRREAIQTLNVGRGDMVVDIGCGTGLNFALLQEAIGNEGRIIGIDVSSSMLAQAQKRVDKQGWKNVVLIEGDAAQLEFPSHVDGIVSTYALTLIPECEKLVCKGCAALGVGKRWVVLDMAWPPGLPLWFRHVLFFLRSYGVTGEVLQRQPWKHVWNALEQHLTHVARKEFWMGFFYLACGTRDANPIAG